MNSSHNVFAIKVQNISKLYKLYSKPVDRVKEALNPLGKTYHKDFYALKDLSFSIKKGETVGIVGKNGSGKSTLLKIITGVLTPSHGSIEVNGRVSALLELGAGFNPEYTGIENIYLNGTLMGYKKEEIDEKLEEILLFADIGDFVYQPVKTYSSGMFVRLAFAVAINVDPDILIIDEALSVGDVRFQQKCYAKFETFKKNGKTILFVTHSLESIKMYCNRAILLDNGDLLDDGSPKEVVNHYLRILRQLDEDKISRLNLKQTIENKQQNDDLQVIENSIWYNPNEYKYGTNEAFFCKCALNDLDGNISDSFEVGSYMDLILEFIALKDLEEIFFGFGIRNVQGQDIFVFNGTPQFENFPMRGIRKGQTYRLKIRLKMFLVPNDYTFALSLTKLNIDEVVQIQIRYDVLLFKIYGRNKLYAGYFCNDTEVMVQMLH